MIQELRQKHKLEILLSVAQLPRATFCYHLRRMGQADKYESARAEITGIYHENKGRYGERRGPRGDVDAVEQVLWYNEGYINKLCTRTVYDESGFPHACLDEYMKSCLENKLIRARRELTAGPGGRSRLPFPCSPSHAGLAPRFGKGNLSAKRAA